MVIENVENISILTECNDLNNGIYFNTIEQIV